MQPLTNREKELIKVFLKLSKEVETIRVNLENIFIDAELYLVSDHKYTDRISDLIGLPESYRELLLNFLEQYHRNEINEDDFIRELDKEISVFLSDSQGE